MEHASTIDIGARKRRTGGINEDSVATAVFENHHRDGDRPVGVFVLADGVGGEASGDVASFLATTVVRKHLVETVLGGETDRIEAFGIDAYEKEVPTARETDRELSPERIRGAIETATEAAHQHIQSFAGEIGGRPATTLVAAVYVDGRLHYGWVGDSRIYLINTEHEEIQQLTRDHAVTDEMLERGEIDDEAYARVHPDTTAITNALGGSPHGRPTVDVEFGDNEVFDDDVIMLTSDGLVDAYPDIGPLRRKYETAEDSEAARAEILDTLVTDDELLEIVLDAPDLSAAVKRLVEFANDRGGKDNLSITLANDPGATTSPSSLPPRQEMTVGAAADRQSVVGRETTIEPAADPDDGPDGDGGGPNGDGDDEPDDKGKESNGTSKGERTNIGGESDAGSGVGVIAAEGEHGRDDERAAITIAGQGTIFQIEDGVTIGRDTDDDRAPNIGLAIEEEAVEPKHARIERTDGSWRVRDVSSSGTYVETGDGDWVLLLSPDGQRDLQRKGVPVEDEPAEHHALTDEQAFSLQDPREDRPIVFQFFSSVERAQNRAAPGQPAGDRGA